MAPGAREISGDFPAAWVKDDLERRRRDLELRDQLVGHEIARVRYVELRYEGQSRPMSSGPSFDSVDYGIEFDLNNQTTWSVIWLQRGHNEALLLRRGPLVPSLVGAEGSKVRDVTDHWVTSGPASISRLSTVWTRHGFGPAINSAGEEVAEAGESDLCLITLILGGAGTREAVITLGERNMDGTYGYTADNVAVFFSVREARVAHVLLPGDPEAISQAD